VSSLKDVRIADDGEPIGAASVGGFEQAPAGAATGVIMVHGHFAADDVEFFGELFGREGGVLHDVAEDIDGGGGAGEGH
jgi:hypothetical protein